MKMTRYTIISFIFLFSVAGAVMSCSGNDDNIAGDASATRAESAVAIYRIYNYMAERR